MPAEAADAKDVIVITGAICGLATPLGLAGVWWRNRVIRDQQADEVPGLRDDLKSVKTELQGDLEEHAKEDRSSFGEMRAVLAEMGTDIKLIRKDCEFMRDAQRETNAALKETKERVHGLSDRMNTMALEAARREARGGPQ